MTRLIAISLCMIVKNERDTLARCLSSVGTVADEVVVVDTGSTDNTREIAAAFTDKVYDFEWADDFAAARNASFAYATREYIIWMDADDVLREADRRKLEQLKQTVSPSVDAVSMRYHLAFDEAGNVTFGTRRHRLVRRANGFRWHGAVHEYLAVAGNILRSDIAVTHLPPAVDPDPRRNLRIYEQRLTAGEAFSPRDLFYYANECCDNRVYETAIEYYHKFLATQEGWVEDNIRACGSLADCYHFLGATDKELEYTLKSFEYDTPRPEFCCRLGFMWMLRGEWLKAIFWYKLATTMNRPSDDWGFFNEDVATWLPHIQLCVCYDHIGEHRLAYEHNEMARRYRPADPQVLQNKRYLEAVLGLPEPTPSTGAATTSSPAGDAAGPDEP